MDLLAVLSLSLLGIGLAGSLAGSLLLPLLGRLLHRPAEDGYLDAPPSIAPTGQSFSSVAILIPAPRSASQRAALVASCASITAAIEVARRRNPTLTAEIFIGTTDPVDRIPSGIPQHVRWVTTRQSERWSMLRVLVERAWAYDWIAVVEPGTRWSPDVLMGVVQEARQDAKTALISPLHGHSDALSAVVSKGFDFVRNIVSHPNHLSSIPMPFRPATTFYRSDELVSTFRELRSVDRPHGDLVIPFVMRALHPAVRFVGVHAGSAAAVIPPTSQTDATSGGNGRFPVAVDCFHVLRSLQSRLPASLSITAIEYLVVSGWVYWTSSILLGGALLLNPAAGLMVGAVLLSIVVFLSAISAMAEQGVGRSLADEVIASLLVPLYILFPPVTR